MEGLEIRPWAALEYWFCKLHAGDVAFLVDVILRRRVGTAETRVSLWVANEPRIEHAFSSKWTADAGRIATSQSELTTGGSHGAVSDIEWDLTWNRGPQVIPSLPGPVDRVGAFDTWMQVHPRATFDGSVTVGGVVSRVAGEGGVLMHYWGRRLADKWLWVSASRFENDQEGRVEVLAARSRLFGRIPLPMPMAYAWLGGASGDELVISPLNGIVRTRRSGADWVIDVASIRGRRHAIVVSKAAAPPNDLGEGITQTLRGDLSVDGIPAVPGTVGLETRGWPL